MLTIIVPGTEHFNEETQEFTTFGDVVLELEHSLAALSKWESIYEKPFLGKDDKTNEEVLGYILQMIVSPNPPKDILQRLSQSNIDEINAYINAKSTATWFREQPNAPMNREVITAELIYHWLISFRIPLEVEHWHLNRLFTLLKITNAKNEKPKKMSMTEIAARNQALNERRRAELGTRG